MKSHSVTSIDLSKYADAVTDIKNAIVRCRYRSLAAVNKEALSLYFGVGKFVSENSRKGQWGQNAIDTIAQLLQKEMPGLRGFSASGIRRMRLFYEQWNDVINQPLLMDEIHPSTMDELQINENLLLTTLKRPIRDNFDWSDFISVSFTHHSEIIAGAKDIDARLFYIHQCAVNAWSVATLKNFIKADLYSNRGTLPNNFTNTLSDSKYASKAILSFKDEYLLDMVNVEEVGESEEDWDEKVIENQIVNNVKEFILRFGKDFTFVDSQHVMEVEGEVTKADLIFFNRELNASVIVELKKGKFRTNYLGQLSGYLTAYDLKEKKDHENPSIGIILCRDANKKYVEIMVQAYNQPLGVATYRTADEIPEKLKMTLPDMDKITELITD